MSDLKVGDKVLIRKSNIPYYIGEIGVIECIFDNYGIAENYYAIRNSMHVICSELFNQSQLSSIESIIKKEIGVSKIEIQKLLENLGEKYENPTKESCKGCIYDFMEMLEELLR